MARIALLLTPGFADWEYALIAGTGAPFYGQEVRFFSPTPGHFLSQGGLPVIVDADLQHCADWQPDVVVVVGGMIWESAQAPDVSAFLQACLERDATVAGICGGTLALARAGLLNTVHHTSNSIDFLQTNAAAYKGSALYQDSTTAVIADRIITAKGSAPVSFTGAVFQHAGLPDELITQFKAMLAAEHQ